MNRNLDVGSPGVERRISKTTGVLIVSLLLVACSTASPTPTVVSPLDGTGWVLISLNGDSLIEGSRITLRFADGFVNGFAGCNGYESLIVGTDKSKFMYWTTEDGTLTIPGFVITEKDCPTPPGVMQQEVAYVEALRSAAAYRVIEDRLEIDNAAGETTLVFTRRQ